MDNLLYTISTADLHSLDNSTKQKALTALESGQVIYCPALAFALDKDEKSLLSESILAPREKNISYDYCHQKLSGLNTSVASFNTNPIMVQQFMHRYAEFSKQLIDVVLPQYSHSLRWGRTSFRPAEIKNRKTSAHKDDTRLHVDSFPSTPVNGQRILRIFCNINPHDKPRVWHIGEPFEQVLATFLPRIPPYSALKARLLQWIKATKKIRSPYDHYMLKLHNSMKTDDHYQNKACKHRVDFPPQSTWMVFTDHVSHAALSGQFLLEQTFYLPVDAMENQSLSPLRQWEKATSSALIY